jgi:putative colanic acid biosynthesis UDP-glucose lipid carrier transferase
MSVENVRFRHGISHYAFRHHMKPGITGWAQVNGCRGETPTVQAIKDRVDLDICTLIIGTSFWTSIILRTITELARGPNAF